MHDDPSEFQPLSWLRAVCSKTCTLDTQESLVLLSLVRRADDRGQAYPGMGTVCDDTRVSRRKVILSLAELERRGLFTRERQLRGQAFGSNHYQLPLEPPASALSAPPLQPTPRSASRALPSAPGAPPLVHPVHQGSASHAPYLPIDLPNGSAHVTAQAPKPSSPKKGTRAKSPEQLIPTDWRPTEAHREFATKHALDLELEVIGFLGHYDQQKVASPNGRFTTWLANQAKWNRGKSNQGRRGFNPQRGVADPSMLRGGNGSWLDGGAK